MFHTLVAIISSWACIETLFAGPNLDTYCVLCSQSAERVGFFEGDWLHLAPQDILMVGVIFQKLLLATEERRSEFPTKIRSVQPCAGLRYLALSQDKGSGGGLGSP